MPLIVLGVVFSMLGVINNYKLESIDANRTFDTIGHKLVTYFENNQQLEPPLPTILASIFLYDTVTGKLQSIIEGTEITSWRTAACSLVSTKYLYFNRIGNAVLATNLAIVGCGVQVRNKFSLERYIDGYFFRDEFMLSECVARSTFLQ